MGRGKSKFVHTSTGNDPENREKDDYYPTPAEATISLLALEDFEQLIDEPACGEGAISIVLEAAGYTVTSSDLVDRGFGTPRVDFLMESKRRGIDLVTNPPFKNAEEFVRHAMALGYRKVALMLRLNWLEGTGRKALFADTPLARVHVSSRRLTMLRNGDEAVRGKGGMVAFAWYVWERGHEGPPTLTFFDWAEHAPEIFAAKGCRASADADPEDTKHYLTLFDA